MKLLYWIISVSVLYILCAILLIVFFGIPLELIQLVWLIVLTAPLYNKWLAKQLKYTRPWE